MPKREYIGGKDYRVRTMARIPGFTRKIWERANAYGVDPNLILHRIGKEGWVDQLVQRYNALDAEEQNDAFWRNLWDEQVAGYGSFGLDYAGSNLLKGLYSLKDPNATWHEAEFDDEEGGKQFRKGTSLIADNLSSAIEILAADMAYRQGQVGKLYGKTDRDLNTWTNASFNMGLHHKDLKNDEYIQGKYTYPDYYTDFGLDFEPKSFGGLIQRYGKDRLQKYFANGGSIHIKPSHRGRLTELKARTGKTEAELYNDGNPAHKKMVVFARNSRKWHSDGGSLLRRFDEGGDTDGYLWYNPDFDYGVYGGVIDPVVVTATVEKQKRDKQNDALAKAIIDRVNHDEATKIAAEEAYGNRNGKMGEAPLVNEDWKMGLLAAGLRAPWAGTVSVIKDAAPYWGKAGLRMLRDLPAFEFVDRLPTVFGGKRMTELGGDATQAAYEAITGNHDLSELSRSLSRLPGEFVAGAVPGMAGDILMRSGAQAAMRAAENIKGYTDAVKSLNDLSIDVDLTPIGEEIDRQLMLQSGRYNHDLLNRFYAISGTAGDRVRAFNPNNRREMYRLANNFNDLRRGIYGNFAQGAENAGLSLEEYLAEPSVSELVRGPLRSTTGEIRHSMAGLRNLSSRELRQRNRENVQRLVDLSEQLSPGSSVRVLGQEIARERSSLMAEIGRDDITPDRLEAIGARLGDLYREGFTDYYDITSYQSDRDAIANRRRFLRERELSSGTGSQNTTISISDYNSLEEAFDALRNISVFTDYDKYRELYDSILQSDELRKAIKSGRTFTGSVEKGMAERAASKMFNAGEIGEDNPIIKNIIEETRQKFSGYQLSTLFQQYSNSVFSGNAEDTSSKALYDLMKELGTDDYKQALNIVNDYENQPQKIKDIINSAYSKNKLRGSGSSSFRDKLSIKSDELLEKELRRKLADSGLGEFVPEALVDPEHPDFISTVTAFRELGLNDLPADIRHQFWFQVKNANRGLLNLMDTYHMTPEELAVSHPEEYAKVQKAISDATMAAAVQTRMLQIAMPRGAAIAEHNTSADSYRVMARGAMNSPGGYGYEPGQTSIVVHKNHNGEPVYSSGNTEHQNKMLFDTHGNIYAPKTPSINGSFTKSELQSMAEAIDKSGLRVQEFLEKNPEYIPLAEKVLNAAHALDEGNVKSISTVFENINRRFGESIPMPEVKIPSSSGTDAYFDEDEFYRIIEQLLENSHVGYTPHLYRPTISVLKHKYGGMLDRYGKDKIKSAIVKMRQSK